MTLWLVDSALAYVVLPIAYLALCFWMIKRDAWWFTFFAFFVVFGSFGGWCLMLSVIWMGPAAPLAGLGMEFLLLTAAMSLCLASSLILQFRRKKDHFDRVAMFGGYSYIVLHAAFFWFLVFQAKSS